MIPENIKNLIEALIKKTKEKGAIWGKSPRESEFKLSFDKGAVTIDSWNNYNEDYVGFAIYNIHGDKVDNFILQSSDDGYDLLLALHNEARREFYKVDETITGLFNEIKSEKNVGKRTIEKSPSSEDLPF